MDINGYHPKREISVSSLISLDKLLQNDIFEILHTAKDLKTKLFYGEQINHFTNKHAVLFTKNTLSKSRLAFELAAKDVGVNAITLTFNGSAIEEMLLQSDSIKVIDRFGISVAVVDTDILTDAKIIANNLHFSVINANEFSSPCQALSALLTLWESKKSFTGFKAVIIGDINKTDLSICYAFAKCGIDIKFVSPEINKPSIEIINNCRQFVDAEYYCNLSDAIKGADVVYIYDNDFSIDYKLTKEVFSKANSNCILLQNIPLCRGKNADSELYDLPNSLIYNQGENIMHIERAILYLLLKKEQ